MKDFYGDLADHAQSIARIWKTLKRAVIIIINDSTLAWWAAVFGVAQSWTRLK